MDGLNVWCCIDSQVGRRAKCSLLVDDFAGSCSDLQTGTTPPSFLSQITLFEPC